MYASHSAVSFEIASPSNSDLSVPISKKLLSMLMFSVLPKRRGLVNSVQLQNENMQPAAKGVSRGDTSFSFATAAEQLAALASSGDFLTDYKAQLNAYRKMRW